MYKFLVVADMGEKPAVTSKTIHVATAGKKKVSNNTKVTVAKKIVTKAKKLKKSKSLLLKAKAKLKKGMKVKLHQKLRYESTNKKIATVSKTGKIIGKKKGTCYGTPTRRTASTRSSR